MSVLKMALPRPALLGLLVFALALVSASAAFAAPAVAGAVECARGGNGGGGGGGYACPDVWDPVLGDDGVCYSNSCYASLAGVTVVGDCPGGPVGIAAQPALPELAPEPVETGFCICPDVIDPKLGDDGVCYQNGCRASCAGATVVGPCGIGPIQ